LSIIIVSKEIMHDPNNQVLILRKTAIDHSLE